MAIRTTLLEAVNQMLSCIGGSSVVSLDTDNPEIASAVAILEETTRTVLSEGWNFNTEREYPFAPDVNDEILVPDNLISFTLSGSKHGSDYQVVERQGKLYDKLAHSYNFTKTIYCDVLWGFTWQECPQPFKEYITARASRNYASRLVTSKELVELIAQDEGSCRALCIAYDTDTAQSTMFGLYNGQRSFNTFMPFNTLAR